MMSDCNAKNFKKSVNKTEDIAKINVTEFFNTVYSLHNDLTH